MIDLRSLSSLLMIETFTGQKKYNSGCGFDFNAMRVSLKASGKDRPASFKDDHPWFNYTLSNSHQLI